MQRHLHGWISKNFLKVVYKEKQQNNGNIFRISLGKTMKLSHKTYNRAVFDGIPVGTSSLPKHFIWVNFPYGWQVHFCGHWVLPRDTANHRNKTSSLRKGNMTKELGSACEKRDKLSKGAWCRPRYEDVQKWFFFNYCV